MAIHLLFKPYVPTRIIFFKLQGTIPKRKKEIAKNIGIQIERELLSMKDIVNVFDDRQQKKELREFMIEIVSKAITNKMPFAVSILADVPIQHAVRTMFEKESDVLFNQVMEYLSEQSSVRNKISTIVEQKINDFPMEKIEQIVFSVAEKELKHIEYIGGFIGLVIGFFQGILFYVF